MSSPAPPPARRVPLDAGVLPAETVRSVAVEVAEETIAEWVAQGPSAREGRVVHVLLADPGGCDPAAGCVPLAPLAGPDIVGAGHLHRTAGPTDARGDTGVDAATMAALASLIAARIVRDLLDARLVRARHEVEQLTAALETSRTIGIAMGVVMATRRTTAEEAFDVLRRASQLENRKLREVAAAVSYTGELPASAAAP